MNLKLQFLAKVAPEEYDHPGSVDVYSIGFYDGTDAENARLAPIHLAVADLIEALERRVEVQCESCGLTEMDCEAAGTLARLNDALREGS